MPRLSLSDFQLSLSDFWAKIHEAQTMIARYDERVTRKTLELNDDDDDDEDEDMPLSAIMARNHPHAKARGQGRRQHKPLVLNASLPKAIKKEQRRGRPASVQVASPCAQVHSPTRVTRHTAPSAHSCCSQTRCAVVGCARKNLTRCWSRGTYMFFCRKCIKYAWPHQTARDVVFYDDVEGLHNLDSDAASRGVSPVE